MTRRRQTRFLYSSDIRRYKLDRTVRITVETSSSLSPLLSLRRARAAHEQVHVRVRVRACTAHMPTQMTLTLTPARTLVPSLSHRKPGPRHRGCACCLQTGACASARMHAPRMRRHSSYVYAPDCAAQSCAHPRPFAFTQDTRLSPCRPGPRSGRHPSLMKVRERISPSTVLHPPPSSPIFCPFY